MQPIDVENYEEERNRRFANRLEDDDLRYEQFRQEQMRQPSESEAGLVEVTGQADEDRLRFAEQVRQREVEIQRIHRVLQKAHQNVLPSMNAARFADEDLARAGASHYTLAIGHGREKKGP